MRDYQLPVILCVDLASVSWSFPSNNLCRIIFVGEIFCYNFVEYSVPLSLRPFSIPITLRFDLFVVSQIAGCSVLGNFWV